MERRHGEMAAAQAHLRLSHSSKLCPAPLSPPPQMDSAVMMGHSFGAATSLASCADVLSSEAPAAKFSACIAFDAWL